MGFELTTLVVIGTNCIGNCKSNYHIITATIPIGVIRLSNKEICETEAHGTSVNFIGIMKQESCD